MKRAVVFDFDGTIADTFRVGLDIYYEITGRGAIPKGEIDRLRGMSLVAAVKALKVPVWKAPFLLSKGRKKLAARMAEVELFYGMPDVIRALQAEGYELHIISLNSETNIRKLLRAHHLEDAFTSIHGKARFRSKTNIVKKLMQAYDLEPKNVVYIGDEIRDVAAARGADIAAIAVTWGYNNIHVLEQSKPAAIVFDTAEIPRAVKEIIG